jgi:hypothetical protein
VAERPIGRVLVLTGGTAVPPVQRRAAQRTVRCNRLLSRGIRGPTGSAISGTVTGVVGGSRFGGVGEPRASRRPEQTMCIRRLLIGRHLRAAPLGSLAANSRSSWNDQSLPSCRRSRWDARDGSLLAEWVHRPYRLRPAQWAPPRRATRCRGSLNGSLGLVRYRADVCMI